MKAESVDHVAASSTKARPWVGTGSGESAPIGLPRIPRIRRNYLAAARNHLVLGAVLLRDRVAVWRDIARNHLRLWRDIAVNYLRFCRDASINYPRTARDIARNHLRLWADIARNHLRLWVDIARNHLRPWADIAGNAIRVCHTHLPGFPRFPRIRRNYLAAARNHLHLGAVLLRDRLVVWRAIAGNHRRAWSDRLAPYYRPVRSGRKRMARPMVPSQEPGVTVSPRNHLRLASDIILDYLWAVRCRLDVGLHVCLWQRRLGIRPPLCELRHHPPRPLRLPASYRCPPRATGSVPSIGIVTPSYNQAGWIERTIRSVTDQGFEKLQYVVQDGASSDGTPAVLERLTPLLSGWASEPDGGQAQAINRGFARIDADVMAYLNSDDLLLPGSLGYVARFFQKHPEVDVVYGHRVLIDENDMEIGRWVMPPHEDRLLDWADYIPQETMFWRRRIWDRAGGYIDESYRFALDWEMILRFREHGAVFRRLPRLMGAFRIHPFQKTSSIISEVGEREMQRLRRRCLGYEPTQAQIHHHVRPYLLRQTLYHYRHKIGLA